MSPEILAPPVEHLPMPRPAPEGKDHLRPLAGVLLAQVFSFGLYEGFWFFRNARHVERHRTVNPWPVRGFLGFFLVPFGLRLLYFDSGFSYLALLVSGLLPAALRAGFLYHQLTIILDLVRGLGCRTLYRAVGLASLTGAGTLITACWGLVPGASRSIGFWIASVASVLVSAAVLVRVQRVLNFLWSVEARRSYGYPIRTPMTALDFAALALVGLAWVATAVYLVALSVSLDIVPAPITSP